MLCVLRVRVSMYDISVWNTNVNLMVVLEDKVGGSSKSVGFIPPENMNVSTKLHYDPTNC